MKVLAGGRQSAAVSCSRRRPESERQASGVWARVSAWPVPGESLAPAVPGRQARTPAIGSGAGGGSVTGGATGSGVAAAAATGRSSA